MFRKQKTSAAFLFVCAFLTCVACGPTIPSPYIEALRQGSDFELSSIDPGKLVGDGTNGPMRSYTKLGSIRPSSASQREAIIRAIERSVRESGPDGVACFAPRHAVRVKHKGTTFDFMICFECHGLWIYNGDERLTAIPISEAARPTLNEILGSANIPLAPVPPKRR